MSLAFTPPMLVIYAECSSSGIITLVLQSPYVRPLFLGVITITNVRATQSVIGKAFAGANQVSGGNAELQANADEYAHLRDYVPLAGRFTVSLGYEPKARRITEIICATDSA